MTKPILPFVEMMVTQACNLSCHGCTNYSDLAHNGYLSWNEGKQQISDWLVRVDIPDFGILGGEPLMNPQIRQWIIGLRNLMPHSQIRFTTNGLLLNKNLDVIDLLHEVGNCVFKVAVHKNDSELEQVINYIKQKFNWEAVVEHGIHRYRTDNNLRFHLKRPDIFYKTYQGTYQNMYPHDSNPQDAFGICCQQTCPLLYKGKIYKCSTQGLLQDTLDIVGNPNMDQWNPYLIDGLSADCTDKELNAFLQNFGKAHSICRMCPTKADTLSTINHLQNVSTKKIKFL